VTSLGGLFVLALGAALCMTTLVWVLSLVKRDAGIIDIFWRLGFVLVAWLAFFNTDGFQQRKILVVALVTLWGVRLATHIFVRSLGKGEDYRYREMRDKRPGIFWIWSLFGVFWLQAVILWFVSAPILVSQYGGQPERLTWLDGVGAVVFLTGFLFESIGDWQLARFKSVPANTGKVMNTGLWRYTRHPNYFGDALVWWGLFLIALSVPGSWWTVASPMVMTFLLMKVSGVALLEKSMAEKKPAYRDYILRTNAFFPGRPR
jgi:steroid 5-alpha reductase family enzyme